jgi:DNA-binding response OmpR family regulator
MRILIVETDPVLAYQAIATLEAEGHEVFGPAVTAGEALQWAACENLDLALVDVDLDGDAGGIALARELRSRHGVSSIFVSSQPGIAPKSQDAALGLLRKPFEAAELVDSTLVAQCLMTGGWPPPRPVPRSMEIFRAISV